jgi:putative alpha-1,2-mannosidase
MDKLYQPTPDGYCGDEDNGQTSAWYVFSAMGLYPVCPGTDEYVLGSPLFNKVTLHLENGNTFVIEAPENNSEAVYIGKATLNGETWEKNFLKHDAVQAGGTFRLDMSARPNRERGIGEEAKPYSMSRQ